MNRIKNYEEFKKYQLECSASFDLTSSKTQNFMLYVGMATCGIAAGAKEVFDTLNSEIISKNIKNAKVTSTGCLGYCYAEPVIEVRSSTGISTFYAGVTPELAIKILDQHIIGGTPLEASILTRGDAL